MGKQRLMCRLWNRIACAYLLLFNTEWLHWVWSHFFGRFFENLKKRITINITFYPKHTKNTYSLEYIQRTIKAADSFELGRLCGMHQHEREHLLRFRWTQIPGNIVIGIVQLWIYTPNTFANVASKRQKGNYCSEWGCGRLKQQIIVGLDKLRRGGHMFFAAHLNASQYYSVVKVRVLTILNVLDNLTGIESSSHSSYVLFKQTVCGNWLTERNFFDAEDSMCRLGSSRIFDLNVFFIRQNRISIVGTMYPDKTTT